MAEKSPSPKPQPKQGPAKMNVSSPNKPAAGVAKKPEPIKQASGIIRIDH